MSHEKSECSQIGWFGSSLEQRLIEQAIDGQVHYERDLGNPVKRVVAQVGCDGDGALAVGTDQAGVVQVIAAAVATRDIPAADGDAVEVFEAIHPNVGGRPEAGAAEHPARVGVDVRAEATEEEGERDERGGNGGIGGRDGALEPVRGIVVPPIRVPAPCEADGNAHAQHPMPQVEEVGIERVAVLRPGARVEVSQLPAEDAVALAAVIVGVGRDWGPVKGVAVIASASWAEREGGIDLAMSPDAQGHACIVARYWELYDLEPNLTQVVERRIVELRVAGWVSRVALWDDDDHSLAGAG